MVTETESIYILGRKFARVGKVNSRWGSSVSTVSDYRLDDSRSISGRGKIFLLYPLCSDQL
jgi:hypothetical protein